MDKNSTSRSTLFALRSPPYVHLLTCFLMFWLSGFLAFWIFTPSVSSGEQVPVGVRPIGLGSAFFAVADDGTAINWNPAGLSQSSPTINIMYCKLFDVGKTSYLSAIVPASEKLAIGMDWTHLGIDDEEINFARNELNFSYSYQPISIVSLGINLKYISNNLSLDGSKVGSSSGWGTDFGILLKPTGNLSIGFAAFDALSLKAGGGLSRGTNIKYDTGANEIIFPISYKFGVAYKMKNKKSQSILLAMGIDDRIHIGAELSPLPIMDIRGGIQRDLNTSEHNTYSLGFTVQYKWVSFNYAYLVPPTLPDTSLFSLALSFDFRSPPVEIEMVRLKDMYPVHQIHYANKPNYTSPKISLEEEFAPVIYSEADLAQYYPLEPEDCVGRVWLRNKTNKPLSLKVRMFADKYISRMGTDVIGQLQLLPGERVSAPLRRIAFTKDVLLITDVQSVGVRIEVISVDEPGRRAKSSSNFLLHSSNSAILDDIAKLASFISPTNKVVREFVEGILAQYDGELNKTKLNPNLYKAMLLFNALHGMAYATHADPNIPFGSGQMDEIKFPHETLRELAKTGENKGRVIGDCDDTTALYCSLLEAAHIHTALIKLPGHVLMAFDIGGLTLEDALEPRINGITRIPDGLYIPIDGCVWIPIETTFIKEGFVSAWQKAIDELQGIDEIREGHFDSKTLRDAWQQYPPANIPGYFPPRIPKKEEIDRKVKSDMESEWMRSFVERGARSGER